MVEILLVKPFRSGLAESIPGVTMDRQCGSGLESIIYACRMVQAGRSYLYSWRSKARVVLLGRLNALNQYDTHHQNFMSVPLFQKVKIQV